MALTLHLLLRTQGGDETTVKTVALMWMSKLGKNHHILRKGTIECLDVGVFKVRIMRVEKTFSGRNAALLQLEQLR